ncbi:AAA family ATPase [Herbivorax sp. ANBcel31]|uniref:ATP-dependent nuclease n=1 Tax=Herbivorax sp. ANBcel31 TaxID=3069754 RepID=UPI0027B5C870|nr:ATP-binding protein [Herbivorax sp. ANBcel31]MDQ2086071.1 AAA family ATPase [Herbivorax sp. ANBcel31]
MFDNLEKLISDVTTMYDKGIIKNRLKQLKIHHFRKFANDSELNFTCPLTVIVGKNGSGKTTVMKAIKLLSGKQLPQNEFFETVIDDGGFENTDISYLLDGTVLQYKRLRQNKWGKEGKLPPQIGIEYIQTKTMIGAVDKSFLYDNVEKKINRIQKVEYIIKQSRKLNQNPKSTSERKQRRSFSDSSIQSVNDILQGKIKSIEIVRHKYFSGTWGTSVIFNDGCQYSEYNAGSGEFVVANMVDKIERMSSTSILLLDEPEVSLHPGAQKRLICYILEMIKRKKIQVIITTHSTNIIDRLPKSAIKCFRKMENGTIAIGEETFFKNAFLELEADFVDKKYIIVEDGMAKNIIDRILTFSSP